VAYKLLLVSDFDPAELARIDLTGVSSHEAAVERIQRHSLGWSWCHQQAFQELGVACSTLIPALPELHRLHHAEALTVPPAELSPGQAYVLRVAQAEQPQVLVFENPSFLDPEVIAALRKGPGRPLLVTHFCAAVQDRAKTTFALVDLVLCCSPHFVDQAQRLGAQATLLYYHAAPDSALERPLPPLESRLRRACFVGSIVAGARYHGQRLRLLQQVSDAEIPIDLYSAPPTSRLLAALIRRLGKTSRLVSALTSLEGYLTVGSRLRQAMRPPVYGPAMFDTLQRHICAVNVHAGMARGFAANMRLFEAAALGVCLISEDHPNLGDLFEPDQEILTYRCGQELIQRIRFCVDQPEAACAIGERARKRALASHRYAHRVGVLHMQLRQLLGQN
jgi:spore maturation protein CgeB